MSQTPLYPQNRVSFLFPDAPPPVLTASLGVALVAAGIDRSEIDRILDDVGSAAPGRFMAACAKYVFVR